MGGAKRIQFIFKSGINPSNCCFSMAVPLSFRHFFVGDSCQGNEYDVIKSMSSILLDNGVKMASKRRSFISLIFIIKIKITTKFIILAKIAYYSSAFFEKI